MVDGNGCAEVRPLLQDLATGAVVGEERAAALLHVAGCPACRSELADLATVVDGLLLTAPQVEPPGGFESAVMARLEESAPARRRSWTGRPRWEPSGAPGRRRLWTVDPLRAAAAAVVALVMAVGLGAGAVWWHTAPDRELASRTRQTLDVANGRYLDAIRISSPDGTRAGTVFLYQGAPSWLLVSVSQAPGDGDYRVVVTKRGGASRGIGTCRVVAGAATYGYQLYAPVKSISTIVLEGPDGVRLTAQR